MFELLYVLLGLVLLVWPGITVKATLYALGAMLAVYGIGRIVWYFVKSKQPIAPGRDLFWGIIGLGLGLFVLLKPEFVVSIMPGVFGLVLLATGIGKLQIALDMRRLKISWWIGTIIIAILSILLAIVILMNPFSTVLTLVRFFGLSLIINGSAGFVSDVMLWKNRK